MFNTTFVNKCRSGNIHTFCKQEKGKQKNKNPFIPPTGKVTILARLCIVTTDTCDFRKRTASAWESMCWFCPISPMYSTCGSGGEKRYGKFMLCSSDSAIQIRNCTSAYWSKRDFMWLSETWVSLLSKAWIKAWHVPHCGNQNMNSTTLPVMGPKTNVKIVYNFVQGQIWKDLWIIPEESLLKIRQIYKMS